MYALHVEGKKERNMKIAKDVKSNVVAIYNVQALHAVLE